jgi:hypothetical protein
MRRLPKNLKTAFTSTVIKYRDLTLFLIGLYFFFKGIIELAPGVQLPHSRWVQGLDENVETVYALLAIVTGQYLIWQHTLRHFNWWYQITRNVIFFAFLFQVWVMFATFTADPPYDIYGWISTVLAAVLGSIYIFLGVKRDGP